MNRSIDARKLEEIRQVLAPHLHRTPTVHSATLSALAGCRVHLKQELFQKTGSYKPRGMLWALLQKPREQIERGVITFSAGNAAQGLAYAARLLDVPATIVMPLAASATKAQATRDYGAEVILHGTPAECLDHCRMIAASRGLTFISSYDDFDLMCGHATMGSEILEDVPSVAGIFVGIGGGGMAGGLALAMSALRHPTTLIGVEPEGAASMYRSMKEGHPVKLDQVKTIADGLAAPNAGQRCFDLIRERFEAVKLVSDSEILNATKLLMTRCKLFAEPAGAAALAGLLGQAGRFEASQSVVCIVSGGNLDLQILKSLL
jgi:threonine dehydratase